MVLLLLLAMLTVLTRTGAVNPEDLSGKMFTFPEEKNASVELIPATENFTAATVCLRFYTHLHGDYSLFSLASSATSKDFLIYRTASRKEISVTINNSTVLFGKLDVKLNTWHSVCSTWDSETYLAELWFDGNPLNSTSVRLQPIHGPITITVGQVQNSYGEMFAGNISDMHMWDFELTLCEIKDYVNHLDFPPGNVLDWSVLEYKSKGDVLIQSNG